MKGNCYEQLLSLNLKIRKVKRIAKKKEKLI